MSLKSDPAPLEETMNSNPQVARVLWIGAEAPDPACLSAARSAEDLDLRIDRVDDFQMALGLMENGKWDATIVDQAILLDPPIKWLEHLCDTDNCGEVVALIEPRTSLRIISEWVNGLRSLRLLIKPFDAIPLFQLLHQLPAWRMVADQQKKNVEVSPWLHLELARLTKQATIDQLTGLLRREEMMRRANKELVRARRSGQALACIMCDIDHFKRVNDVFGHQTGDRTLQRVSSLLGAGSRPYDLVGRMGGEEFMLIMPGPSLEEGTRIAERLRSSIEHCAWQEESLPNVTVSFGVAEMLSGEFGDLTSLIKAADMALYKAKNHGRNQVCLMNCGATVDPAAAEQAEEEARPHLLLVDDASVYLNDLSTLLSRRYMVDATTNPEEALAWTKKRAYELVITDENMPKMKGHELLARIKGLQPRCVRIIMTSHGEFSTAIQAINEAEVYRYVLKPWNDDDLLLIVHQALEFRLMVNRLRNSDRETIKALADTLELRNRSTRGHYHRVAGLSWQIAAELRYPTERLQALEYTSWLHDIGKIGIPDAILKKQSPLSAHEEKIIREHPQWGANLVASVEHIAPIASLIRHHHERFDGHGYPDGMAGETIPEESRILAIANAYDGLLMPRRGHPGLTPEQACEQIILGRGTLFDPALIDIFKRVIDKRLVANAGVHPGPAIT